MITTADGYKILGVNTRHYPAQASVIGNPDVFPSIDQSDDPPPTRAVLVAGDIGDYACYVGHGTAEWVARHGDKISFEEACCHFPGGHLEKARYRS